MAILAMLMVNAIVNLISMVSNVIHALQVVLTFLHAKVKINFYHYQDHYYSYCICNFIFQILACGCNTHGSDGSSCNSNGVCSCKANIIGSKCDSCASGRFNFPICQGKD